MFSVEKLVWSHNDSARLFWEAISKVDGLKKAEFDNYVIREDMDSEYQPGRWKLDSLTGKLEFISTTIPRGTVLIVELQEITSESEWQEVCHWMRQWLDKAAHSLWRESLGETQYLQTLEENLYSDSPQTTREEFLLRDIEELNTLLWRFIHAINPLAGGSLHECVETALLSIEASQEDSCEAAALYHSMAKLADGPEYLTQDDINWECLGFRTECQEILDILIRWNLDDSGDAGLEKCEFGFIHPDFEGWTFTKAHDGLWASYMDGPSKETRFYVPTVHVSTCGKHTMSGFYRAAIDECPYCFEKLGVDGCPKMCS